MQNILQVEMKTEVLEDPFYQAKIKEIVNRFIRKTWVK